MVNSTTDGNQYNPSMGFKSNDGAFVVSWTSDGQDGSGEGIFAQRVRLQAASRIGGEFQVNSITPATRITRPSRWTTTPATTSSHGRATIRARGTCIARCTRRTERPTDRRLASTRRRKDRRPIRRSSSSVPPTMWWFGAATEPATIRASFRPCAIQRLLRPENRAPVNTVPGDQNRQREYAIGLLRRQRQRDPDRRRG